MNTFSPYPPGEKMLNGTAQDGGNQQALRLGDQGSRSFRTGHCLIQVLRRVAVDSSGGAVQPSFMHVNKIFPTL